MVLLSRLPFNWDSIQYHHPNYTRSWNEKYACVLGMGALCWIGKVVHRLMLGFTSSCGFSTESLLGLLA